MRVAFSLAGFDDAGALLELQRLAYHSEAVLYGDFAIPALLQTLEGMQRDLETHTVVKGTRDGELVASARAQEVEGTVHIGRVIVHPRLQGQGLGKRVMAAIEARFPEARRFELFTGHASLRKLHLYRSLGYRDFRTAVVSPALSLIHLEKRQLPRTPGERPGQATTT